MIRNVIKYIYIYIYVLSSCASFGSHRPHFNAQHSSTSRNMAVVVHMLFVVVVVSLD